MAGSGILLLLSLCLCCSAYMIQVEPKSQECFSVLLEKAQEAKFHYQVVRGGLLDINVKVLYEGEESGPKFRDVLFEQTYFENEGDPGLARIIARRTGIHTICFDNTMARFTAKVVRFKILQHGRWGMPDVKADGSDPAEMFGPMEISARRISEELEVLELHQQYMRSRALRHASTQKSTNRRVFWFSVLEALSLLGISVFQVFYIKRFFNTPKRLI